ncbi:4685_t:CDS:1, partial [Entrophospora sp. SA101]
MASVLSSIVFVKTVSAEKVCTSTAYDRVDNKEFVKSNFKALL